MGYSSTGSSLILAVYWYQIYILVNIVLGVQPQSTHPELSLVPTENGTQLSLSLDGTNKLLGTVGVGYDFRDSKCIGQTTCTIDDIVLNLTSVDNGFEVTWTTNSNISTLTDCFDLNIGDLNWYGGPQWYPQEWPLEKLNIFGSDAYIGSERYWLNSAGAYIFLDDRVPLFVEQNHYEVGRVCFTAKQAHPYVNRTRTILKYTIVAVDNPKVAHLHAVNNYLGKPEDYPDERMVREPTWTTWTRYKKHINDKTILEFAQDIRDHGFEGGQLEIDDGWEIYYGSQKINRFQFFYFEDTVDTLHQNKFRVTLWVHPFVNDNCSDVTSEGLEKDFFVTNDGRHSLGSWWNGLARQIDFTNPHASRWYAAKLDRLRNLTGIDSFRFDAGETYYSPQPSVYPNVDQELIPNILTEKYIRTASKFGKLVQARSAFRTQDLPIFTRMLNKDSVWGDNNGIYTLITTLLQLNMNGYSFVLPDMFGGMVFDYIPTVELFARWTQANTFMPAMQFNYLPWDIDNNGTLTDIVKEFVELHAYYSDEIINAMKSSVKNGSPVNPPIWWVDPTDTKALATDDEYLLGEAILVAPVIIEGATSRDVYLPKGTWKDGNSDKIYEGPITIEDYPAPLEVLPYFIKQ